MTGRRGPRSKASDRAQGHRARIEDPQPALTVIPGAGVPLEIPKPPTGLLKATRLEWEEFWESAEGITRRQMPAVIRLFQMRDELARARRVVRRQIMTTGSMGQIRVNPLASHCLALEAAILKLEDQYGLTPASRARLVGDATSAIRDAAEIQALFALPDVDPDEVPPDPRLRALEAGDAE